MTALSMIANFRQYTAACNANCCLSNIFLQLENHVGFGCSFGYVASMLIYTYLACMQVIKPMRDLPIGLLGSVGVVTVLYLLMSATIVLMVPYYNISTQASFADAFEVGSHSHQLKVVGQHAALHLCAGVQCSRADPCTSSRKRACPGPSTQ